jgi:hypothetical protein
MQYRKSIKLFNDLLGRPPGSKFNFSLSHLVMFCYGSEADALKMFDDPDWTSSHLDHNSLCVVPPGGGGTDRNGVPALHRVWESIDVNQSRNYCAPDTCNHSTKCLVEGCRYRCMYQ